MKYPWLIQAYRQHLNHPRTLVGVTVLDDGPSFNLQAEDFGKFIKATEMSAQRIK